MKTLLALIIAIGFVTTASAQPDAVMDMVNTKAAHLIDSIMDRINLRADVFNDEMSRVNKLRPLEMQNLTKEKIAENIPGIKDFLSYLDLYRSQSEYEKKRLDDSVTMLRSYLPKSKQKKYLKEFVDAYALDRQAFDVYTRALTNLYTDVIGLLEFVSASQAEVKDDKLLFPDAKEMKQYQKLVAKVDKLVKKQASASLGAQKATFQAGEIMQKTYGKLH